MHVLSAVKSRLRFQAAGFHTFQQYGFALVALGPAALWAVSCSGTDDNDAKPVALCGHSWSWPKVTSHNFCVLPLEDQDDVSTDERGHACWGVANLFAESSATSSSGEEEGDV